MLSSNGSVSSDKILAKAMTADLADDPGYIRSIRDGMKSCSNRRWANREDLVNVPGGTRECLQRARVAEGPKVR